MFSKYLFAFFLYVHFSLSLRTVESSQAYIQFTYKYFFVNTPATYILLYQMNFLLRCFKFPKRLRRSSYSEKLDFRCFKSQITVLLQKFLTRFFLYKENDQTHVKNLATNAFSVSGKTRVRENRYSCIF